MNEERALMIRSFADGLADIHRRVGLAHGEMLDALCGNDAELARVVNRIGRIRDDLKTIHVTALRTVAQLPVEFSGH